MVIIVDAELTLYGSSCNGFGKCDSDMDICMTFSNKSGVDVGTPALIWTRLNNFTSRCVPMLYGQPFFIFIQHQEMVSVIKKVSKCLFNINHLKFIQPITTAKVCPPLLIVNCCLASVLFFLKLDVVLCGCRCP